VQRRTLNAEEKAVIAAVGLAPSLKTVDAARNALDVAVKKGELAYAEDCALHVDSSPGKGYYWVYFWAFGTDAEGAALFCKIIAVNRASCRAILEGHGTALALAQAMYTTRYFEGFRIPGAWYIQVSGRWTKWEAPAVAAGEAPAPPPAGAVTGRELNVMDYGNAVAKIQPGILTALQGWAPSAVDLPEIEVGPPPPDGMATLKIGDKGLAVSRLQQLLGDLTVDGDFGPNTAKALRAAQVRVGLPATGVCDEETWRALLGAATDRTIELEHAARLIHLSNSVMAGTDSGADALERLLGKPREEP
jgi:hypothetical protein